ncbi:MAG TPA: nuclear transport factor 2 family protein [Candidatus Sulfotelmatobacter sp.]|nr:nuclear transport factor 2 family protein [Candidatus Sulfotelmatobacter sp.]
MKKLITVSLVLLAFVFVPRVWAQNAYEIRERELAKEADAKQEELINLERDTVRAMQFNNGTLFRRVYGDDFVGVLPSGQVKDKAGWIASVENPGVKYASFIASDIRVRLFQDTAVVTCLWSSRGTRGDQSFYRQYRVTHIYVYSQHGWQVVASQETLLPG